MFRKTFCLIAVLVILPTFTANAAGNLSSFSVFATNSVWVRLGADVNSGNIGVTDASPGPWLNAQSEVSIGRNVYVADGVSIYGDSIKVKTRASAFDVYYNELTNNGTIRGSEYTPLVLPLDITMPAFPTPAPGTEDHVIPRGGSLTLDPGSYGKIKVRRNATLILTGGTYHFENLDLGILNAKVLFQAPTDLIINNRLGPGINAVIGPEDGSGISAKEIRIYVNGINGGTGNLRARPKAAQIGFNNTLRANIYAPNGTLWIKWGTVAEGAFIGRDVKIGVNVQLSLNSGIGGPGPDDDLDGDGFTENQGDCDDNDASINPDALEVCDGVDNNCDGQIDEGVKTTYYEDSDSDGYGNPGVTTEACEQPSGYVTDNTDCNDNDVNEHPGQTWYKDADNDSYSDGTTDTASCVRPTGYKTVTELTAITGDCNDGDASINPAAQEVCDGVDNNCDGQIDEGVKTTYYADSDSDGYGNPGVSTEDCQQPSGYVTDNTDCDDNDPNEHPGQTWYKDADNDGYSDGTTDTVSCTRPTGYKTATELTATSGDCNDGDALINPAVQEVCDGVDNNCDGQVDEGVTSTYYADLDGDSYGDPNTSTQACTQPSGYVTNNTDCDDNDAAVNPGTTEIPYNGKDDDCNVSTPDDDLDGDGYVNTSDCNDNDPGIFPGATETPYDGIDQDCDGSDLNDLDFDGYVATQAGGDDCNDNNAAVNPGATEITGNGIDDDCNPATTDTVIEIPEGTYGEQYEGLIPTDATIGSYDDNRFAIITGSVKDSLENPVPEIVVSIHGHPEYGTVQTDSSGVFSIPVEGGGTITVVYKKSGFITSHRKVYVPWNDIAVAETVTMISEDTASTTLSFDGNPSTIFTHNSTTVTDEFGSRSLTMVFRGDNQAFSIDESGNETSLTTITTRATEFDTPESMPAKLPPNSAYTYCTELSVDGADKVRFDKPVIVYVDNFLGFDVGGAVPVGYYDRESSIWVPSNNGVVVKLLDTDSDGIVDALDSTGDDQPDDLNSDGFFNDEVLGLDDPVQYSANTTYWRFEAGHFTPWDCNWPFGPPPDAVQPNPEGETSVDQQTETEDERDCTSSYVERRSRIFHEDIPIPGTDFTLHYASNRVSGYKSVISIPVSGASVPASLKEIKVIMRIAGQVFEQTLSPLPDQKVEFVWDGLDHLGNSVTGLIVAYVNIGFVYDAFFITPGNFAQSFAQAGNSVTTILARQETVLWKNNSIKIYRAGGTIAEGWTLSSHHSWFQYSGNILFKGDGTTINNGAAIITTVAGNGQFGYSGDGGPAVEAELSVRNIAVDSIGNLYIADSSNNRIRKVDTGGIITTVAGNGQFGYSGDDGPATEAMLKFPYDVAVDSIGNLYIADALNYRIRKVDTSGIITTVAGNGQIGYRGDGGPATDAELDGSSGIAVDSIGNIYIANDGLYTIRKVDTNGIITTVAGNGQEGYSGDGGPAVEAELGLLKGLAVDSIGNLYIVDQSNSRVRKVDTSGIITTVAGIGQGGYSGDGGPATEAELGSPNGIAVDGIGNMYIADQGNMRIRKVDTSGVITTVAGNGQIGYSADGGPATEAEIALPDDIAVDSIGNMYIVDLGTRVRKVSFPEAFAGLITAGETAFTDENGLGYIMDSTGLHKSTIDLSTGNTLLTFGYDQDKQLITITDRFNNQTTIQRDISGIPFSITSPDGIVTGLTVDGNNHLTQVTYPDNTSSSFTYDPGGLMTDEYDLKGNHFVHIYDGTGKVTDINDPEGGTWDYSRSVDSDGNVTTTVQTGELNTTTYLDRTESTGASTSVKTAPDGSISTLTRASDGITETNELSCGMTLDMKYDLDSEYQYRYLKDITRSSPAGLAQTTTNSRSYQDTDADDIPDLITDTVDINGKSWTSADDTLTGMITNTSPLGRVTTVEYNTTNLLTEETVVTGLLPLTFSYDARGRLTGTTVGTRTTTMDYDANGYLDYIITPDNKTYDYTFDVMGRLTQEDRPEGVSIDYDYDSNGNMTLLVTPKNISHTFDYTGNDQRKDYTTPQSGSYLYVYDKERKLKTITFPSTSQIQNTYTDGLLSNTLTPENSIDYTYECTSLLSGVSMGTETVAYTYDGSLLETDSRSGILNKTISYTYDNNHRLSSVTYAGSNYALGYDDDSLLTSIGSFTITRDADNGLPEAVNDGTLSQTRSFNGYGEIDNYSHNVNGSNVYDVSLTRDNSGRITQRIEVIGAETITWDYVYDDLGRLIEVKQNSIVVESYEYDTNGNRTLETNTMRGIANKIYDYTNEDHIISAGSDLYVFDDDGFLVDRVSAAGTTTYNYSLRGELLSVDLTDGRSVTYDHDPMGRRIAKKIDGTVVEKYLWRDNTTLLAVYDASDNLIERFNYADGRLPISMLRGGNTYYMMHDQVGSLRLIVDSSGNITKRIDYDSFGNIINDTTPGFTIPFGFAGGLHDIDTGLVRFGARDFDTTIGRWTAKDPIDFAGGDTNLYGYAQNNPVNWIDPWGQEIVIIGRGFYDTYLEPALKPTSDIFDVYQGAKQASKDCPTEPWLEEKLDEIARSDMVARGSSDVNSQVPATTTEPNSNEWMDIWADLQDPANKP